MNDIIFLNEVCFYGYHGVLAAENNIGQIFVVDITLKIDLSYIGWSGDVEDTVNYGKVYKSVKSIVEGPCSCLVEHLAGRIAKHINSRYNRVVETKVRVTKESPLIPGHYDGVGIEIMREND